MPKFTNATYDEKKGVATFVANDGSMLLKKGGSVAWRFFNPGNVQVSPLMKSQPGWIGSALVHNPEEHNFSIFSSYENGRNANKVLLKKVYSEKNIYEVMKKFAPGRDGNRPKEYADRICKEAGINKDTQIKEMSDEAIEKVLDSIQKAEGYIKGTETVVNTTNITVSDGARTIPHYPFKVTLGEETYDWATNVVGKLDAIIHSEEGMNIEIKAKNSSGNEVVVYKARAGNQTKNILLIKNSLQYTAKTQPDNPNPPRKKEQPTFISYIVRPDDKTLESIAIRYGTNGPALAQDNEQAEDSPIYPGQMLAIYGAKHINGDQPSDTSGQSESVPAYPSNSDVVVQGASKGKLEVEVTGGKNSGDVIGVLPPDQKDAPWMQTALNEAKKFKGQHEGLIEKEINYIEKVTGMKKSMVTTAWCASFANYCLNINHYPMWESPTVAKDVMDSSDFMEIKNPVWGAIACLSPSHSTFFYGFDKKSKDRFIGLGGNQTNTINFVAFPLSKAKFFIPFSYKRRYDEVKDKKIEFYRDYELNAWIGIGKK